MLATGRWLQALDLMRWGDFEWPMGECTLRYMTKLRSNDPTHNPLILTFQRVWGTRTMCVYGHLRKYMGRAQLEGADPAVFTTMRSPHVATSQETLSHYVRNTMFEAEIDMKQFTSYSCRHVTMSAAVRQHVPIMTILMAAGWTGDSTFRHIYNSDDTNLIPDIWTQDPHT